MAVEEVILGEEVMARLGEVMAQEGECEARHHQDGTVMVEECGLPLALALALALFLFLALA
jgi:hypothetical protein